MKMLSSFAMTVNRDEILALEAASKLARSFMGRTAPNPPVGAAGLSESGELLGVEAHHQAGLEHAEARLIRVLRENGKIDKLKTVLVTLEPCNHTGRTPPCTDALIGAKVKRVIFAEVDPNPKVKGAGQEKLRQAGIEVVSGAEELKSAPSPDLEEVLTRCRRLIAPFRKWILTERPWVVVKTAYQDGSMIPPKGAKTFTSEAALKLAHQIRRESDAILTGSGTVLADLPEFTVRRVEDHAETRRWLVVLDRRKRVPEAWTKAAIQRGFHLKTDLELEAALEFLGRKGCHQVLVEAGPLLSQAVLSSSLWDESVVITREKDQETIAYRLRK
jgi:diaminohydroxyphosphoribosylaminopyrimidine deaminase/5-amino-6-(5-phosphoribosylamino)uracil reductase